MLIGIPREIKLEERRVSLTPNGVKVFMRHGHRVIIEQKAGLRCNIPDNAFREAGGTIVRGNVAVWGKADMIIKVKEPLEPEFLLMQENQIIFTFLHLAANRQLTVSLLKKKVVGIAYETVQVKDGTLPILKPMSEIAGRLSVQIGAQGLEAKSGGRGILMGGAKGVSPARVTILGGGSAGFRAAEVALGMGGLVTVLEINKHRVNQLKDLFGKRVMVERSTPVSLERKVVKADLVIGAVLNPGAKAPKLITRNLVKKMKPGAVIVDIAVDQGGCCETIRPTTHAQPFYSLYGVVHCGITNLPSTVPLTSTLALTKASLPYALEIACKGYLSAAKDNPAIMKGINVVNGKLANRAVAEALGLDYCNV
jgi:alanine dehydrogenase